jgi:GTP-binding protein HflX
LEDGQEIVVSDTVGFIRELPHGLVAAFRATLEETAEADLLLHVVDSSSPDRDEQIAAVNRVLEEIGAGDVEQIMVLNKVDLTPAATGARVDAYGRIAGLALSAQTGAGVPELKQLLMARARRPQEAADAFTGADADDRGDVEIAEDAGDAGSFADEQSGPGSMSDAAADADASGDGDAGEPAGEPAAGEGAWHDENQQPNPDTKPEHVVTLSRSDVVR